MLDSGEFISEVIPLRRATSDRAPAAVGIHSFTRRRILTPADKAQCYLVAICYRNKLAGVRR